MSLLLQRTLRFTIHIRKAAGLPSLERASRPRWSHRFTHLQAMPVASMLRRRSMYVVRRCTTLLVAAMEHANRPIYAPPDADMMGHRAMGRPTEQQPFSAPV